MEKRNQTITGKSSNKPCPFTFHVQVKETFEAQNTAERFRYFFDEPQVTSALDKYGKVHFARTVLIPKHRIHPSETGTFAFQVMLVYDGTIGELLDFFLQEAPFRNLFQQAATFGIPGPEKKLTTDDLKAFIQANNINRHTRELHKGYRLSVSEIKEVFPPSNGPLNSLQS